MAYTIGGSPRSRPLAHRARPRGKSEADAEGARVERRCPVAKGSASAFIGAPSPAPVTLPGRVPLGTKSARTRGGATAAERESRSWPGRGHVPAIALSPDAVDSPRLYTILRSVVFAANDRVAAGHPGEHASPAPNVQTTTVSESASRIGRNQGRNHTANEPGWRAERGRAKRADSWRRRVRAKRSVPLLRAARSPTCTASAARRAGAPRAAAERLPRMLCTRRRTRRADTTSKRHWCSRSPPACEGLDAGGIARGGQQGRKRIRPTHLSGVSHAVAHPAGSAGGRGSLWQART